MGSATRAALAATFQRELTAHRLNRFLLVHLAIAATAGFLPLFTPTELTSAAPWWLLQAVLYALSLSALLLGLSSAHGEADEFPMLFTQPVSRSAWMLGKAAGLAAVLVPAALLLVAPVALAGGLTSPLTAVAVAAAGVTLALAAIGLALGFWVRDRVRGLLAALGVWFVLLFGTDLLLLAVAGAPWVQAHPTLWALPLMLNPLDALRVTVLFGIGDTAPAPQQAGTLVSWWMANGSLWLTAILTAWVSTGLVAGVAGSRARLDS